MKSRLLTIAGLATLGVALVIALGGVGLLPSMGFAARNARDADAIKLETLGQQAVQRAAQVVADPVLHQVDVSPNTGSAYATFRFTDAQASIEVDVGVPTLNAPPDQWQVRSTSTSKLVGFRVPAITMAALKVGPNAVEQAMTTQWRGCAMRSLTLFGTADDINWTASCDVSDGRVAAGTVENRTGAFHPSPAPPAFPPPTAMPSQ
jgi:hypothetical protein